jgi:hypothetical protein
MSVNPATGLTLSQERKIVKNFKDPRCRKHQDHIFFALQSGEKIHAGNVAMLYKDHKGQEITHRSLNKVFTKLFSHPAIGKTITRFASREGEAKSYTYYQMDQIGQAIKKDEYFKISSARYTFPLIQLKSLPPVSVGGVTTKKPETEELKLSGDLGKLDTLIEKLKDPRVSRHVDKLFVMLQTGHPLTSSEFSHIYTKLIGKSPTVGDITLYIRRLAKHPQIGRHIWKGSAGQYTGAVYIMDKEGQDMPLGDYFRVNPKGMNYEDKGPLPYSIDEADKKKREILSQWLPSREIQSLFDDMTSHKQLAPSPELKTIKEEAPVEEKPVAIEAFKGKLTMDQLIDLFESPIVNRKADEFYAILRTGGTLGATDIMEMYNQLRGDNIGWSKTSSPLNKLDSGVLEGLFVKSRPDPDSPRKVVYHLTEKGLELSANEFIGLIPKQLTADASLDDLTPMVADWQKEIADWYEDPLTERSLDKVWGYMRLFKAATSHHLELASKECGKPLPIGTLGSCISKFICHPTIKERLITTKVGNTTRYGMDDEARAWSVEEFKKEYASAPMGWYEQLKGIGKKRKGRSKGAMKKLSKENKEKIISRLIAPEFANLGYAILAIASTNVTLAAAEIRQIIDAMTNLKYHVNSVNTRLTRFTTEGFVLKNSQTGSRTTYTATDKLRYAEVDEYESFAMKNTTATESILKAKYWPKPEPKKEPEQEPKKAAEEVVVDGDGGIDPAARSAIEKQNEPEKEAAADTPEHEPTGIAEQLAEQVAEGVGIPSEIKLTIKLDLSDLFVLFGKEKVQ